jgi:hypothetical protein
MLEFIRDLYRNHAYARLPGLVLSMAIAEFFYKFRSFILECIAFLATWYALDWIIEQIKLAILRRKAARTS